MPPAARLSDLHECPIAGHIGGPIVQTSAFTVLIGGAPAATIGDLAACVGSVDTIVQGSSTVMIVGKPAARMGDATEHGGTITAGCPIVTIGG